MELLPEWHEFLGALKRHGVRFLLVGAHALAAHGRPRFTQDLDVLVDPTPANARRVAAAIAEFGFTETARPPNPLMLVGMLSPIPTFGMR